MDRAKSCGDGGGSAAWPAGSWGRYGDAAREYGPGDNRERSGDGPEEEEEGGGRGGNGGGMYDSNAADDNDGAYLRLVDE